jgi:fused signal recognition particle receptor
MVLPKAVLLEFQIKIPVKYIGVGEGIDLQVFNKHEFVDSFFK